jgi:hypothetical protein
VPKGFGANAAALTIFPAVTAGIPVASSSTAVTLNGTVTGGNRPVTERGWVYSSSNTDPLIGGASVTQVTSGSGTGSYTSGITGLSQNVRYYLKSYAIMRGVTVYSAVRSFWSALTVSFIGVGGGGGAGTNGGGGGGAGGYVNSSALGLIGSTYTVTVGGGGAAATQGTTSVMSIAAYNFIGGGAGGNRDTNNTNRNGGSGGGGGGGVYNTAGTGTTSPVFQGFNGGAGTGDLGGSSAGGGGGGRGSGGTAGSSTQGGNGGNGVAANLVGTTKYYAGGGAGSGLDYSSFGGKAGTVQVDRGGGGPQNGDANGRVNSGGGGGSLANATNSGWSGGGSGGSGVVVIRLIEAQGGLASIGAGLTYTTGTVNISGTDYRWYEFTAGSDSIVL